MSIFSGTWLLVLLVAASLQGADDYAAGIEAWRKQRLDNLRRPDGWLSLVGLFWLKEGDNRFGGDPSNDIVFPGDKADPFIGVLTLKQGTVTITVNHGVDVRCHGERVGTLHLAADDADPTILSHRTLLWYIVKRGERYGVRLKDTESELLRTFKGLDYFPIDRQWALSARFEAAEKGRTLAITNALGQVTQESSPGAVIFAYEGRDYRLDVVGESGNEYFIVFGDRTNGEETYGGGRFLYIPKADAEGRTVVDFNKAYNPPCVFTPYATCPLPPQQNVLPFKVTAGEKMYGSAHH